MSEVIKPYSYYICDDLNEIQAAPDLQNYTKLYMYKKGAVLSESQINNIISEYKKSGTTKNAVGLNKFCDIHGIILEEMIDWDGYKNDSIKRNMIISDCLKERRIEFENDLINYVGDFDVGSFIFKYSNKKSGHLFKDVYNNAIKLADFMNQLKKELNQS